MPLYGYKISGLARSEKYFEAEKLLDLTLKGFEKDNAVFSEDGSITQRYSKKNEDGSETEVTLVKNITESGIMVFSDIPLKYLKWNGKILYLRDVIPTLILAGIYWKSYSYGLVSTSFGRNITQLFLIAGFLYTFISLAACKILSKNRSALRVRFMALGSVFSVFTILKYLTRLSDNWTIKAIWKSMMVTPVPSLMIPLIIMIILQWLSNRR